MILQLRRDLQTEDPTDADLIEAAYLRWGPDCAARLIGDYAFVVWAVDRSGSLRRGILWVCDLSTTDPMGND